ncbi:hypothetical protein F7731_21685 [Cytobacillus depressus]|uniref:Uncharacterized protein n=1 Tax=Cytobacillus depressus TaxID=1602942 RepID=A0A6L3UZP8_9BACI|nr:hypothetical protein [Cytobacillus depressus]KAB2329804.1 hypothetical protein F7731_21685 [Cytobacillus depressus]
MIGRGIAYLGATAGFQVILVDRIEVN